MRTSKQVSWTELRVGLFVLMALGMASVFVFYMTQAGTLFSDEERYVTYLPDAAGLENGAPVRLVGFAVGTVESVGLSEFRDDPKRHAKVVFRAARSTLTTSAPTRKPTSPLKVCSARACSS
ncbi:MAG: MlaD family protein [Acidobacteria bacterium]|nr:MlaD family protein [Acidobacteriota bacterium]